MSEDDEQAEAPAEVVPALKVVKINVRWLFQTHLTVITLLDELAGELRSITPSHTWDNLPGIAARIKQLRSELEELSE